MEQSGNCSFIRFRELEVIQRHVGFDPEPCLVVEMNFGAKISPVPAWTPFTQHAFQCMIIETGSYNWVLAWSRWCMQGAQRYLRSKHGTKIVNLPYQ